MKSEMPTPGNDKQIIAYFAVKDIKPDHAVVNISVLQEDGKYHQYKGLKMGVNDTFEITDNIGE